MAETTADERADYLVERSVGSTVDRMDDSRAGYSAVPTAEAMAVTAAECWADRWVGSMVGKMDDSPAGH